MHTSPLTMSARNSPSSKFRTTRLCTHSNKSRHFFLHIVLTKSEDTSIRSNTISLIDWLQLDWGWCTWKKVGLCVRKKNWVYHGLCLHWTDYSAEVKTKLAKTSDSSLDILFSWDLNFSQKWFSQQKILNWKRSFIWLPATKVRFKFTKCTVEFKFLTTVLRICLAMAAGSYKYYGYAFYHIKWYDRPVGLTVIRQSSDYHVEVNAWHSTMLQECN